MKVSEKEAGIVISYLTEAVKILTTLIYTPIMLRLLGQSEYGLYQLVHSVAAYLGLIGLGFGSAYMRFYSRAKVKNDEEEVARLNGMFLTIFCIIAAVCLLCGTVMVFNASGIFGTGLTSNELDKAKILMTLMVFNLALTFPNSIFNNFVIAHERFIFQKTLIFLQALLNPFLTLPLLMMGCGSVAMILVSTFLTIVVLISNVYFGLRKLKVHFLFRGFTWPLLKEMFVFTFFLFLNQIIDQINWSVDKFLLGRMIGTTAVAVYAVGSQLNSLYIQISTSISNVFVPQINRLVAEDNDDHKLTLVFTKVGRMQFLVLAFVMTGIVFFGQSFIRMWAGDSYNNTYYVALLLIIPETIPLVQNLGIEVQRAKNKHKARSIVYFFMAIANIFISIPLISLSGEAGAAMGTTVSLIVANIFFMNWYYHHKINIDILYFWKNILSVCKGLIIPIIVGMAVLFFANTNGWIKFLLWTVVYSIIYIVSMWLFGMNCEEKSQIKKILKKFNDKG